MEEELGRPIGYVFSSISERPIAAASIGQVLLGPETSRASAITCLSDRVAD